MAQESVLRRFKGRLDAAAAVAASQPRRWRAFRPAIRFRRPANDNQPPLGLIVARVLLIATLVALGIVVML